MNLEGAVRDRSLPRSSDEASIDRHLAQFTLAARQSERAAETVRSRIQDIVSQSFDFQLLDLALKAGDWLVPVKNALADIVSRSGPARED